MMMPCTRCLENNWAYAVDSGVVVATCRGCDAEVSFLTKQAKRKRDGYKGRVPDVQTNAYLRQDVGDNGVAPWD